MNKILIIDDEPGIRTVLTDILEDEQYKVYSAADGVEGLQLLKIEPIDLVLLDVWLPRIGGIDVLRQIKEEYPEIEVVIISGHANIDLAVKAVKLGAFDFLEKPLSLDKILTIVKNALKIDSLRKENKQLKHSIFMEDDLIGNSSAIMKIREIIDQTAKSDARIMILGENGTGKELVAKEIHRRSRRNEGPFVEFNCAAIPDTLIESELFGHEKGAFTGAVARRKGKFEIAHTGTLFLDEIADMSLNAQAKVLRVIQEQRFERVGGEESIRVDIRIIAATNKNIQEEIKNNRFREDLFFRLNVVPITVPPLRERPEDIGPLVDYFLEKFSPDIEPKKISSGGMDLLIDYLWPGNVRELKNFVERISVMTDENEISADVVTFYLDEKKAKKRSCDLDEFDSMSLNEAKAMFEKRFLIRNLELNGYNLTKTAETLGIYPSNLHGKIRKYGIKVEK